MMEGAEQKVREYIQNTRRKSARYLQRLVQEESVRGRESKAQAIIIEKCRELGLKMDIWAEIFLNQVGE